MLNVPTPVYSTYINTPTYHEFNGAIDGTLPIMVLTGDGGLTSVNVVWNIQKTGRIVFLSIEKSPDVTLSAPGAFITTPPGTIPLIYRPLSGPRVSTFIMTRAGVDVLAYVRINVDGSLLFARTPSLTTGFTAPANTSDYTQLMYYKY